MNTGNPPLRAAILVGVLATLCALPANASLSLKTVPSSVYQHMTTSLFWAGLTVIAGTNITRVTAGGSFSASCMSAFTPLPVSAERSLTSEVIGKYNQLYVTVPSWLPAMHEMPGFDSAPRGSRLNCSFNWRSFAREATYTVGIPGSSVTIGGGEATDSGMARFVMQKPATGEDNTCIP